MTKKEYAGYEYVENGVCAAQGFTANGLNCGINPVKTKNDLGMIFSEKECTAAAVYTQNKVKGAPILVTKSKSCAKWWQSTGSDREFEECEYL